MTRRMYKVHKWFAVTVGVFFLMWLISGIVMILPRLSPGPARQQPSSLNFRGITVSPAEAVAGLAKILGESAQVNSVTLRRIGGAAVYEIVVAGGDSHLIDPRSGQPLTITPDIVEQIARDYVPSEARVLRIERVKGYSYAYQWGPLPAYRIVFDNDPSRAYYVSSRDGTVYHRDREDRIRGAIGSLHTFQPLKLIIRREAVRKGLLLLVAVLGIGVAVTGYYLAVPRRRVSRHALAPDTVEPRDVSEQMPDGSGLDDRIVAPSSQRGR